MATYYIYSPFSNQVIGSDCYCYRRSCNPCPSPIPCPSGQCRTANCGPCVTPGATPCVPDCPTSTAYSYCKDLTNCVTCGGSCFCNSCCKHKLVGPSGNTLPLDIAASASSWIYAYMSAGIASVKIVHTDGVCSTATGDITRGTYLEAYTGSNASGKKLGSLLYGHLQNRQHPNNHIINKSCCTYPWFVSIGQVPSVPANQTCYLSTHVHHNIKAESSVAAYRTGSSCGTNLSAGVSAIYWWVY